MRRTWLLGLTTIVTGAAALVAQPAVAATGSPVVVHQEMVTQQDVASRSGSETDTVVEPDVAVNPTDADNAIAAAHDSRYRDGGAVGISAAWTHDGGATWHHQAVPGITTATGGAYERASDPVVAYGPDGTAYLSVLLFDATTCRTAVAVLTSTDGGQQWSAPHYAHRSPSCNYDDDKNWLVVDNSPASPHYGRLYQFWTPFIARDGHFVGSPQTVRWSDDKGLTWSASANVVPDRRGTQDSQPMIMADGTIVDAFYDFGAGVVFPDVAGESGPPAIRRMVATATPATIDNSGPIYAATSHNGGRTWTHEVEVAANAFGYSPNVRCCLMAADIDPVTQRMYVAYEGGVGDADPVYTTFSDDGQLWSSPERVSQGDSAAVTRVNVDVVARAGTVYVAYGTRTQARENGGFVQQQLSTSTDKGISYGAPMSVGPVSALQYAARAGGYFPGDYIGLALTPGRLYLVWARSSKPPVTSTSPFHQVIWGATLRP